MFSRVKGTELWLTWVMAAVVESLHFTEAATASHSVSSRRGRPELAAPPCPSRPPPPHPHVYSCPRRVSSAAWLRPTATCMPEDRVRLAIAA